MEKYYTHDPSNSFYNEPPEDCGDQAPHEIEYIDDNGNEIKLIIYAVIKEY